MLSFVHFAVLDPVYCAILLFFIIYPHLLFRFDENAQFSDF
jgi:hypothetical protein